jgi:hypothetical protein
LDTHKKKDNPNDKEIKPQNNFAKNIYPTVDIDAGCLSIITKIYREQIKLCKQHIVLQPFPLLRVTPTVWQTNLASI